MEIYHANIFIGEADLELPKILNDHLGFLVERNPDYNIIEADAFGINEARDLEEWAIRKPIAGDKKVLYVETNSITFEAQNALLKVLEEPLEGTYFFIKLPNLGNVLPTLLSRVRIFDLHEAHNNKKNKEELAAHQFINNNIDTRLSQIKSLSKKEDKFSIKNFLGLLEKEYYRSQYRDYPKNAHNMKHILIAKKMSSIRGGSSKMVLEWLASVL